MDHHEIFVFLGRVIWQTFWKVVVEVPDGLYIQSIVAVAGQMLMEKFENYSSQFVRGAHNQQIFAVDEVVVGRKLMERFENYSFQFVPGSHIQPIVAVDEVVDKRKLMGRFENY